MRSGVGLRFARSTVVVCAFVLPCVYFEQRAIAEGTRLTVRDQIETTRAMTDVGVWNRATLRGSMLSAAVTITLTLVVFLSDLRRRSTKTIQDAAS